MPDNNFSAKELRPLGSRAPTVLVTASSSSIRPRHSCLCMVVRRQDCSRWPIFIGVILCVISCLGYNGTPCRGDSSAPQCQTAPNKSQDSAEGSTVWLDQFGTGLSAVGSTTVGDTPLEKLTDHVDRRQSRQLEVPAVHAVEAPIGLLLPSVQCATANRSGRHVLAGVGMAGWRRLECALEAASTPLTTAQRPTTPLTASQGQRRWEGQGWQRKRETASTGVDGVVTSSATKHHVHIGEDGAGTQWQHVRRQQQQRQDVGNSASCFVQAGQSIPDAGATEIAGGAATLQPQADDQIAPSGYYEAGDGSQVSAEASRRACFVSLQLGSLFGEACQASQAADRGEGAHAGGLPVTRDSPSGDDPSCCARHCYPTSCHCRAGDGGRGRSGRQRRADARARDARQQLPGLPRECAADITCNHQALLGQTKASPRCRCIFWRRASCQGGKSSTGGAAQAARRSAYTRTAVRVAITCLAGVATGSGSGCPQHCGPWQSPVTRHMRPTGLEGDSGCGIHSIFAQPDYVSPEMAQVLGLVRELQVHGSLPHVGWSEVDPRIAHCGPLFGKGAYRVSTEGHGFHTTQTADAGACADMDSLPPVEPHCRSVPCEQRIARRDGLSNLGDTTGVDAPPHDVGRCTKSCTDVQSVQTADVTGPRFPAVTTLKPGRRVHFSFAVSFWFPAHNQLQGAHGKVPATKLLTTNVDALPAHGVEHVGLRSPPPPHSAVQSGVSANTRTDTMCTRGQAEHVGFRSSAPHSFHMPGHFEGMPCPAVPADEHVGMRSRPLHFPPLHCPPSAKGTPGSRKFSFRHLAAVPGLPLPVPFMVLLSLQSSMLTR